MINNHGKQALFYSIEAQNRLGRDLTTRENRPEVLPANLYPALSPTLQKSFAVVTAELNSELTPWDALLFLVYKMRDICFVNIKQAAEAKREFVGLTGGIYGDNFLATLYENAYGKEYIECNSLITSTQTGQLKIVVDVEVIRLHTLKKENATQLKNSLFLFEITHLFIKHHPRDFILGGKLSHFQSKYCRGKLSLLLEFCRFSTESTENALRSKLYPGDKKPSKAIILLTSFLEKYVKDDSFMPLDEVQKRDLMEFYIQQTREERRFEEYTQHQNSTREKVLEPPSSPVAVHLLKKCVDWFNLWSVEHHLPSYHIGNYPIVANFAMYSEAWRRTGVNPFARFSVPFTKEQLATMPGHEYTNKCRSFAAKLQQHVIERPLTTFVRFVNESTQIDYWADAIDELKPMIEEGEQLYDSLGDLLAKAQQEIVQWVAKKPENEQKLLLKGFSRTMLNEIYPILPYLAAFKQLLHFIKYVEPFEVKKNDVKSETLFVELYTYIIHKLDPTLLDAFHLINEETLLAKLAPEEETLIEETTTNEEETPTVETTNVEEKQPQPAFIEKTPTDPTPNKPIQKRRNNKKKREKRIEKAEQILPRAEKKTVDTTKRGPQIPLSIKREKLVKWILKQYGETCHIKGGHIVFKTVTQQTVVLPAHGKTIAKGTLLSILKQLGEDKEAESGLC